MLKSKEQLEITLLTKIANQIGKCKIKWVKVKFLFLNLINTNWNQS